MISDDFTLYKDGNAFLWTDEHISARMLAAHLDPSSDAASRKPEIILRTVDWIDGMISRGSRILDLGCGPGLYADLLAERGHQVTGFDISRRSIEHARQRAFERNLSIQYECLDYLSDPIPGEYDLVLLIYCDFGSLRPDQQKVLLAKVHTALAPEGMFVMDAFGPGFSKGKSNDRRWHASNGGDFWSQDPHLYLYETKVFAEQRVVGERHVLVEPKGLREFVLWNHWYDEASLTAVLAGADLKTVGFRNDIVTSSNFTSDDVLFTTVGRA